MSEIDKSISVPSSIPLSGRWWKPVQTARFSNIGKDKYLRKNWGAKLKARNEKKSILTYQNELKEKKKRERIEYWERVKAHRKVKLENQQKSEVVQVIRNTRKIKKMKRKQLRKIEKRDTTGVKTIKM